MIIHDISRPLHRGMPTWPGDTPFDFRFVARLADGAPVNVGRVEMSVHTGAHVDAPLHVDDGGMDVAGLPLATYIGPCLVADVRPSDVPPARRGILPADLPASTEPGLVGRPRLLLRSYEERPAGFDPGLAHATPELVDWLAERGVVLLGVDTDSMDASDSKDLPAHHRLNERGIAMLEGLDLSGVTPGAYELVALPLRLDGADGSPVRAVLIDR